ncbi:MAG: hypothetical protein AAFZ15_33420 [Bacteroidota bacterium]
MTEYTLVLPMGKITYDPDKDSFRGQIFKSSELKSAWHPKDPGGKYGKGWMEGDTLEVVCTFHTALIIDPTTITPANPDGNPYPMDKQPKPSDFYGLSVSALNNPTEQEIKGAENDLSTKRAGIVDKGITESSTPDNSKHIFYNAKPSRTTQTLDPEERGTLKDIVYKWKMDFNPNFKPSKGVMNPKKIDIIFGYGDPMVGDAD